MAITGNNLILITPSSWSWTATSIQVIRLVKSCHELSWAQCDWENITPLVYEDQTGGYAGIIQIWHAPVIVNARYRTFITCDFTVPDYVSELGIKVYAKPNTTEVIYNSEGSGRDWNSKLYLNSWESIESSDWNNLGELKQTVPMANGLEIYTEITADEIEAGKFQRVITTDREENNDPYHDYIPYSSTFWEYLRTNPELPELGITNDF